MFRSLSTAASGMEAQQRKLDVTSNNIANASTIGFKKERAEFADLMYQQLRPAGSPTGPTTNAPIPTEIGLGVRIVGTARDTGQGSIQQTGNQLDVAVNGRGYIPITIPSGETRYTRDGELQLNKEGKLVTAEGFAVSGDITIPPDALSVTIAANGKVSVTKPGQTATEEVGQIQLATFINEAGLQSEGGNLFRETEASGAAVLGTPGDGAAGTLMQSALETSNVNVVSEMIDLITGQRAYEINSRSIKAADEMLGQTAQLR